jgi:hypothetical protein
MFTWKVRKKQLEILFEGRLLVKGIVRGGKRAMSTFSGC